MVTFHAHTLNLSISVQLHEGFCVCRRFGLVGGGKKHHLLPLFTVVTMQIGQYSTNNNYSSIFQKKTTDKSEQKLCNEFITKGHNCKKQILCTYVCEIVHTQGKRVKLWCNAKCKQKTLLHQRAVTLNDSVCCRIPRKALQEEWTFKLQFSRWDQKQIRNHSSSFTESTISLAALYSSVSARSASVSWEDTNKEHISVLKSTAISEEIYSQKWENTPHHFINPLVCVLLV